MASLFAPLLSILITFGQPLLLMALSKNLWAANLFLLFVNRKSTVFPALSTALYKNIHFNVSLIHPPATHYYFLSFPKRYFNQWSKLIYPSLYSSMITVTPLIDNNSSTS